MAHDSFTPAAWTADVARADELDSAGRHGEAIDQLVAGVRKGDVEAITRLGKRLLVGDRAPLLPNDGARFLEDASARGGAEAAAVLAVLFAVGGSRAHTLQSALESLVVAAERGWPAAQSQLLALGESPESTSGSDSRAPWGALAARIDLDAWQRPPQAVDLSADPLIRAYPSFLSPRVSRWLIDKAGSRLGRALVYDAVEKETRVHPTRTNTAAVFDMLGTDFVCVLTQLRMAACLGVSFRQFEPMTVLHYAAGEQVTEHYDFVDPHVPDYEQEIARKGQRIVTFLIYLNDDYTGGETEFPRLHLSYKGAAGAGLFFVNALRDGSSDLRTLHAGRPPAAGEKWIVSQFVRDRPVF